ncbi:MAG: methylamine utilization protein [Anaerolineae bacterium]|nr:methylamine utilization protein [Phycisphaerae bacterium]
MLPLNRFIPAVVLVLFIFAAPIVRAADAPPSTQPSSSIRGTVIAEGDVPLAEMVVFLESPDTARAMPPPPAPIKVSQKDAQFSPKMVVVSVGQSVEFLNDEARPIEHNVFSNSPAKRFDLGLYGPGQSKSVVFDKPGPVALFCSIHRYMDGVVFVSPTPYTSRVNPDGHYQIDDVPPGNWIVKTWQRRKRFLEMSVPVTVEAEKIATVVLELKKK